MKIFFKNEKEIYNFWEKEKLFSADPKSQKPKYSLLIPPPNLTGELHLGHAMQHSILDAVARFKRLQGFDVLLLPGVDHAGIQFEATFDKELAKQNLSKEKLGREDWLKRAWQFKEETYKSVSASWRMMGLSADWGREVFTLDPKCQRAVFEEFKSYWEAGLIYKGPYIVQWCPKCNTAIEDVEVEYEERNEKLYFIRYRVANSQDYIKVATTRPETIFADMAVAVNPRDKRYEKYHGGNGVVYRPSILEPTKSPVAPYLKIIRDNRVDMKFGTGALKITPAHDFLDYEIGKDNKLPILSVIEKTGRLTDIAGKYSGKKVQEAREEIVADLKATGDLLPEDEEDYVHNVAVCERCKSVVEPIISEEWFVMVEEMAKEAIKVIKSGRINFLPKNYARILVDWLSSIHDWCISRSLWWGHRIPVWYPSTRSARSGQVADIIVSLESPGDGWVQDEQVLDTWFSSGLWPLSTLGWPEEWTAKSGKWKVENSYFPWNFEISAPEIKFLWIARMIMITNYFTGQVPFKTMFFHGMLRDLLGRKFSKSLGNGIEPQYLVDKWGVDATRTALYTYSIPGRDGRASREILDERGKNFRNFATKVRNIAKFVIELAPEETVIASTFGKLSVNSAKQSKNNDMNKDDRWIRDELSRLIVKVTNNLERVELHLAVGEIYDFVWHKFADRYIESSKSRRAEAQPTLTHVLFQVLLLLHPFMPFLTEEIYQKFDTGKKSIMMESWPKV